MPLRIDVNSVISTNTTTTTCSKAIAEQRNFSAIFPEKFQDLTFPEKYNLIQDLPGSIHEDTVMDGHRQGKKANASKYPLTFLKWWSSLVLKTFTVPAAGMLKRPQPHEAEATTHEAEAITHEAEAKATAHDNEKN